MFLRKKITLLAERIKELEQNAKTVDRNINNLKLFHIQTECNHDWHYYEDSIFGHYKCCVICDKRYIFDNEKQWLDEQLLVYENLKEKRNGNKKRATKSKA